MDQQIPFAKCKSLLESTRADFALTVPVRSQRMAVTANRDDVLLAGRVALLARRLVLYIISKLRCPENKATADPKTPESFWSNFHSWSKYNSSALSDACANNTWMAGLRKYQLEALPVLRQFYDMNETVRDALEKCIEKDATMSAEIALQQTFMAKVVQLSDLMALKENLASINSTISLLPWGPWAMCR